jgi:hypothetical protein
VLEKALTAQIERSRLRSEGGGRHLHKE